MYLRLFRLPLPVVAAVNGHAIAGGAILALCCDRRIVARGERLFGLNEVQVGLPLPGALFEIVRAALGPAHTPEALLEGRNMAGGTHVHTIRVKDGKGQQLPFRGLGRV